MNTSCPRIPDSNFTHSFVHTSSSWIATYRVTLLLTCKSILTLPLLADNAHNKLCIFLSTTSPVSEPWTLASAMWTVAFTVILVIAIIGNCGVLWIILGVSAKINSTILLAILMTSCCSTPRHVDRHQLLPSLPDSLRPSHHHHPDDPLIHLYERQESSYRVISWKYIAC